MIFDNDDIIEIRRFEVGAIVNGQRYTIKTTNDVEDAVKSYENAVNIYKKDENHVSIFLFDYDKNTNINYYDSQVD